MKRDQKFTPKYWICHRPDSDDVILETASKSQLDAINMYNNYDGDFDIDQADGFIDVSLFEIKFVEGQ